MSIPNPPNITPAPSPAPSRQDPANFRERADAYHTWLVPFVNTTLPAVLTWIKDRAADVLGWSTAASGSASAASTSASNAAASATLADQRRAAAEGFAATASAAATTSTAASTTAAGHATAAQAAKTAAETAAANAAAVVTGGTASLLAEPAKIPLADANGRLDPSWWAALVPYATINDIGIAGAMGYGVGICPDLPAGFTPLAGCFEPASPNYGNYQFTDGSVMCWIPAYWLRIGDPRNRTFGAHGVNSIETRPLNAFGSEVEAAAEGFYMHDAFFNAGVQQPGFFRDKYDCSANNGIASSIALAMPMVSGPATGQVGFSAVGATNAYWGAVTAARTRGAAFFPETVQMADALTRLSEAHAQAAYSTAACAWYSTSGVNAPRGNQNNNLRDSNDSTVVFTSAGASSHPNFALTGSGSNFAKTTHNGQASGVADVAGNIWKINPGLTCVATSRTITAATNTAPIQITTSAAHGWADGQNILITSVGGMTALNDRMWRVTVTGANTATLDTSDGTAMPTYTSGGTAVAGTFHAFKRSTDITLLTTGTTLATDIWGANGVAAHSDPVALNFATAQGINGISQRYGNAANTVFAWSTAEDRRRSLLGMPASAGMSTAGTTAMGNDWYYQYVRDQLCVISRGAWYGGSFAGVRARDLSDTRTDVGITVGFAASRYL